MQYTQEVEYYKMHAKFHSISPKLKYLAACVLTCCPIYWLTIKFLRCFDWSEEMLLFVVVHQAGTGSFTRWMFWVTSPPRNVALLVWRNSIHTSAMPNFPQSSFYCYGWPFVFGWPGRILSYHCIAYGGWRESLCSVLHLFLLETHSTHSLRITRKNCKMENYKH